MKNQLISDTSNHFKSFFGDEPDRIFMSPGRINIIGEHIDYNDGYVLPAAIDKYICFAISESGDNHCTLVAKDLDETFEFEIDQELKPVEQMWANYILGVLHLLKERGLTLKGIKVVFSSTIPVGSGLSSSAALECGIGFAVNEMFNLGVSKKDLALIGQKAEHTFAGVMCGIMDQFASVFGKENQVIQLDCISLEYEYHPADFTDYSLLLLDSHVKHTHLTSGYNTRREEVTKGIEIIKKAFPGVKNFRNCSESEVNDLKEELGDPIYQRCLFVVKEIGRVLKAVEALEASDYKMLGQLMSETHEGLSKEYEVSCEEVDFLVAEAQKDPAVLGSRMMGGGFGGCTINLVQKGREDELARTISKKYKEAYNLDLSAYPVKISDGTSEYFK